MIPGFVAKEWCAIIPAAGRGTRMGADIPKSLLEVKPGQTILDSILSNIFPLFSRALVVASPSGRDHFARHIAAKNYAELAIATQQNALGMADAVHQGVAALTASAAPPGHVLVIWGDQGSLAQNTVQEIMALHLQERADVTFPTTFVQGPYIHFARDSQEKIVALLQAREGDQMPQEGESDCGFFVFRFAILQEHLQGALRGESLRGRATQELNFLPLLVALSLLGKKVVTLRGCDRAQAKGINTPEDLEYFRALPYKKV